MAWRLGCGAGARRKGCRATSAGLAPGPRQALAQALALVLALELELGLEQARA